MDKTLYFIYSKPRKRAQLIERVQDEWASIDQETTNDFGREFSKTYFGVPRQQWTSH